MLLISEEGKGEVAIEEVRDTCSEIMVSVSRDSSYKKVVVA